MAATITAIAAAAGSAFGRSRQVAVIGGPDTKIASTATDDDSLGRSVGRRAAWLRGDARLQPRRLRSPECEGTSTRTRCLHLQRDNTGGAWRFSMRKTSKFAAVLAGAAALALS